MQQRARELRLKLAGVLPLMNELQRRILVAAEARAYGRGGVQTLAHITGMSRQTIYRGLEDLRAKRKKPSGRIRRPGGGRKRLRDQHPQLVESLERLIEPTVRGDPQSLLRWTCKSVRNLQAQLEREGYAVSYDVPAQDAACEAFALENIGQSEIGAPGEIRTPDPLVRSCHHQNCALILLANSEWRPLHFGTTEHYRAPPNTQKSRNNLVLHRSVATSRCNSQRLGDRVPPVQQAGV